MDDAKEEAVAANIDDRIAECFASYDAAFEELEDEDADTAKALSGLFGSFVARLLNDAETAAYVPAEQVVAICSKVHAADNAGPGLYGSLDKTLRAIPHLTRVLSFRPPRARRV